MTEKEMQYKKRWLAQIAEARAALQQFEDMLIYGQDAVADFDAVTARLCGLGLDGFLDGSDLDIDRLAEWMHTGTLPEVVTRTWHEQVAAIFGGETAMREQSAAALDMLLSLED